MKTTRKILALALTLALLLAAATCAMGEEEAAQSDLRRLRLGSSVYTVMISDDYIQLELSEEDIADDEIGYYHNDETGLEFDLYQFSKADVAQELSHYTMEEANEYDKVELIRPSDVINGINVGWYRTREMWEGLEYTTLTYIMDTGDDYVELVFWLDGDEDLAEVNQIIGSLRYMELQEIRLGDSSFTLLVPDDYVQGTMTPEDMMDDQVAYWYSDASLMDFDVYQFSKSGLPESLAEYAAEEAASCYGVTDLVTDEEINLSHVAHYRSVEEFEEGEYETLTYIMDAGDEYVEVVFWLDGMTAEAEVDYIIHNLIDESLMEEEPAVEEDAAEVSGGVVPVMWDVTPEHPMIDTDEARALYQQIASEDYPTMEELKAHPVVKQLDELAAYYKELYGNTAEIDTPERNQLREEIKNWFLSLGSARTVSVDENGKHTYAYDGALNRDFQMELVLGLPASGKSTRVADPDSEAMGAFILDVDVIKARIPEYVGSHGAGADAVHFEGFGIFSHAIDAFLTGDMKGVNVILPIVGGNLEEMLQQYILPFEAAGYNVRAKYCPAKENEAAARVVMRELGGGQLINSGVAFNFGDGPESVYNELKDMINSNGLPYGIEEDEAMEPAA